MRNKELPSGMFPDFFSKQPEVGRLKWLPLALALACGAISVFMMPTAFVFPYKYSIGQPWNFKNLQAPFEFEVLRPEYAVKDELEAVERAHGPYYILNPDMVRLQKRHFTKLLDEQVRVSQNDAQYGDLVANSGAYLSYGQQLLEKMYKKGINDPKDDLSSDDPAAMIWLVSGNEEKQVPIHQLLTPRTAQIFLTDSLPFSSLRQPEFLLPMLEKSISPNVRFSDSLTLAAKRRKIAAVISTGITVRKGETIIRNGETVNNETFQKLDSLSKRYETPSGIAVMAGFGLISFLSFWIFFLWIEKEMPSLYAQKQPLYFLAVIILGTLLLVKFGNRVGVAIPLLLPIFGIPILLWRAFNQKIGIATWLLTLFLTTYALDWGTGWMAIQVMGGMAAIYLFPRSKTWQGRVLSALAVAVLAIAAWSACSLSEKVPGSVQSGEVPFFLLIGAFLSLFAFPVGKFLKEKFEEKKTVVEIEEENEVNEEKEDNNNEIIVKEEE